MLTKQLPLLVTSTLVLLTAHAARAGVLNDHNPYDVSIPDNGAPVNSDLALSGAPSGAKITKVKIYYEIRHTYPGNLDVWLTAYYGGAWHDHWLYHAGDLGGTDNIIETRDNLHTWDGASPNQTWYLSVRDRASGNVGYIDFFELWVTYEVNQSPTTPSGPTPSDGVSNVSRTADLDWSCSDPNGDTVYYTVYLEKNDSSPDNVIKNDATGSNADPGTLDYSSHYYWQVKADDHNGGVTWGPVWQFYTVAAPPVPDLLSVTGIPSSIAIGEAFTVTVTAINLGGVAPEGEISASVLYSDGADDVTVTGPAGLGFDGFYNRAPGYYPIYDNDCCPITAGDTFLEAVDDAWGTGQSHSMSFTVTPQQQGTLWVRVRTTMAAEVGPCGACDYRNDASVSGGVADTDQQGWPVRRFAVTVAAPPVPDLLSVTGIPSSISIGEAFTVTVTAMNLGGVAPEGSVNASVLYSDGADDVPVTGPAGLGFDGFYNRAPGYYPIYDNECCPITAGHTFLEAVDDNWGTGQSHSMSFTITPQQQGTLWIRVRTTMAAEVGPCGACDYRNDASVSGGVAETDQQGWPVRRFAVTVAPSSSDETLSASEIIVRIGNVDKTFSLADVAATHALIDGCLRTGIPAISLMIHDDEYGWVYYPSAVDGSLTCDGATPGYDDYRNFDYLAHFLDDAHSNGLQVYAWLQLLNDPVLVNYDPTLQMFSTNGPDPNWVSPVIPGVTSQRSDLVTDLLERYSFDGVRLDHSRYTDDWEDWSGYSRALFQQETGVDTAGLTEPGNQEWRIWVDWRATKVSLLNQAIRDIVQQSQPGTSIGAYLFPNTASADGYYSNTWSGQRFEDYGTYPPPGTPVVNLAIHPMPMLYWQTERFWGGDPLDQEAVGAWLTEKLINAKRLSAPTQVIPVFSVGNGIDYDNGEGDDLTLSEVAIRQYMTLCGQACAQHGISKAAYFYYFRWPYNDNLFGRVQASYQGPVGAVTPGYLDYGSVSVGTARTLYLTLKNVGTDVMSGTVAGTSPFTIPGDNSAFSLGPQSSTVIPVLFQPASTGEYNGHVSFSGQHINIARAATGHGVPPVCRLALTVDPMGAGSTIPSVGTHEYTCGNSVSITALPNDCWEFTGWQGTVADPGAAGTEVTLDGDQTVTALLSPSSEGAACGSNNSSTCDLPDTCDGAGTCRGNVQQNGTMCDDSDPCNVGETCQVGECVGGTNVNCAAYDTDCAVYECDPAGADGNCSLLAPLASGTPCDDGKFCSLVDQCDGSGGCFGADSPCSPSQVCHEAARVCYPDCNSNGVADTFEELALADFNGNGHFDLADYPDVVGCITGPCVESTGCVEMLYSPESCCVVADGDLDGDIDLNDLAQIMQTFRRSCDTEGECDDGAFCNGQETCSEGFCQPDLEPCSDPMLPLCDELNDVCLPDCNLNGAADELDILTGTSMDCNNNGTPDECDAAGPPSSGCNENSVPDECEVTAAPRLFVANRDGDNVVMLDGLTGASLGQILPPGEYGLDYANGITIGTDNTLYVASVRTHEILNVDPHTGELIRRLSAPSMRGPVDILDDGNDHLLVACWATDSVVEFDLESGTFVRDLVTSGLGGLDGPGGLAITTSGVLVVSSQNTNALLAYNRDTGAFVGVWTSDCGPNGPADIAVLDDGSVLVASFYSDSVIHFSATGACLGALLASGAGGLSGPEGLAISEGSILLVASRSTNAIHRYDLATGSFLGILSAHESLNAPTYIAYGSVPHDCNANGVPDDCDIAGGTSEDCNTNGIPDKCEITAGTSLDANANGIPDECESPPVTCSIVAWGYNDPGQCNVPAPNSDFVAVAGGANHSLGLKADGSIVAWGSNSSGQCNVPAPNSGFLSVAGGGYHSLGLKADGSIVAWGRNDSGQCNVPAPNSGFLAVAGGGSSTQPGDRSHSLGLKADGSIVAWGYNAFGQCNVPAPNTGFVAIGGGWEHSLGLKADGSIVAWGSNGNGRCDVPAPNSGFVAVAGGGGHSLGLKADGSIVAWGLNDYGQCNVPAPNSGFVAVAGGYHLSLGLKANGSIVAWGSNGNGQCNVPAPNSGFVAVAGGWWHTLGLKEYFDCNANNVPDWADILNCVGSAWCSDCNANGIPDECDIVAGTSNDYNSNGVSDKCEVPTGMVLIPAGEFQMGDTLSDGGADEGPVHAVYVDAFYMDRYEVTNEQYADALNWAYAQGGLVAVSSGVVYKYNSGTALPYCDTTIKSVYSGITWTGSAFGVVPGKESHPMVRVSWYGAAAYANWRSVKEGWSLCYDVANWTCSFELSGYRLPTEAEWEKASRGGTPGHRFPWSESDTIQHPRANYFSYWSGGIPVYGYDTSLSEGYHPAFNTGPWPHTSPVGSFAPNYYGLADMAGNVWEWCNDWYDGTYYNVSPYSNPRGPTNGTYRVLRGGAWNFYAVACRTAYRSYSAADFRVNFGAGGFRLARNSE